jgi:hypothetical protein
MSAIKVRKEKTTEEMVEGVWRQLRAIKARAMVEDPWAMQALFDLSGAFEEAGVEVMGELRRVGYTWPDIAFDMKDRNGSPMTAETAIKRYKHRIDALAQQQEEAS